MNLRALLDALKSRSSRRMLSRRSMRVTELPVAAAESLEPRALLAATVGISPSSANISAAKSSTVSFDVQYDIDLTEGSVSTLAFQMRMHFNSSELTPDLNAIQSSLFAPPGFDREVSINDESRLTNDGVDQTDKFVLFNWKERSDQTPFPGTGVTTPLNLFTATFQTSASFDGEQVVFGTPSVVTTANNELVVFNLTPAQLALQSNSAPAIQSQATASVPENQSAAIDVNANDADGDTLTYAITGGADAGLFSIVSGTGVVTFANAPDFESPADVGGDNVYNIQVTANDGTVNSAPQNVAITVTDVTEVVPNRAPVISSAATAVAAENQTAAYAVTATDADNDTLTYAISGGVDASLFNIVSSTGVVTFANAPDFETPADVGGDNVYNIQVTANDGTVNSAPQNVAITVTDVTEVVPNRAPVISSAAAAGAAENQTAAYVVTATDADNDALTYAISGGADAALFNIVSSTGVVSFASAPDFENPSDAGANNVYNIQVIAHDGTVNSAVQNVAITVTDITEVVPNQIPVISSAATGNVAENQTVAYTVTATDADNDTLTYSISGGADAALFNTVSSTGVVSFANAPDFETPADAGADNVYNIQVTANDGTVNSAPQNVAITVTDVGETSPTSGVLQGRKWNDLNGDGQRTSDEPFLNGWSIQLINSSGVVVDTQTTADRNGEAGWYQFDAPAGTYTLREVRQEGWIQTAPFDDLAVRASQIDSQFNLRPTQNEFLDWGGRDEKWLLGSNGWHFITPDGALYEWDNSPRTALTGNLVDGGQFSRSYYQNTALLHSAAVAQAPTYTVTAGQAHPNVLFGNQNVSQPGTIRGRKWNDLNGDGQRTSDEPWLNGWTIELVSGPGAVSQSVTTADVDLNGNGTIDPETESGWYQFNNVPAGQWIVREQMRAGWAQTSNSDATAVEAWQLDRDLNLQFRRSLFTNWGGLNERWVKGDDAWYYITPSGEFFRWNNSPKANLSGTRVTTLSAQYHTDPSQLYDARNPFEIPVTVSPDGVADGINIGNQQSGGVAPSDFDGQGNVAVGVRGRNLIITGDNAGNGIVIHTNNDGFITVSPIGNTTVNGESNSWTVNGWATVPGDVRASLLGGDDAVVVRDLTVRLDVEVNSGNGNDYLLVENAQIGRNLDFRAASGDNTVVTRESSIASVARIRTANGSDATYANNVTVGGRVVISTAGGDDLFASRSSTFNRNVSINTGAGDDYVIAADNNRFSGRLIANGSSGSDAINTDDLTSFARTPTVRNIEENSIADAEGLLDSVMQRLVDVGLDDLLG